ncbi:protein-L-isoaspartate(D-aspartate) O-methyltransferase [Calditerrivibrio sp.]|jgi:protein-L-isoaspartate(D-aspartate) O-methyltransferase|uniref:protein-L-isoaspartate(D-aspartate) O-methyltransferase n=1 Tax=Calditerrivibrio sp. TaxID=2792612 RepID=UPI003D0AFE18
MKIPEKYIKEIVGPNCNFDERIIEAFLNCPRSRFVDEAFQRIAFEDNALPIGYGQTISKPSTVAYMTYLLKPSENDKVLEIGTGSGFQCGILSFLSEMVYTVERIPQLSYKASLTLKRLHRKNIKFKVDNGHIGWNEYAPYDKIIVTASGDSIPEDLLNQLAIGGRMVIPVKDRIKIVEKDEQGIKTTDGYNCRFVEFVK